MTKAEFVSGNDESKAVLDLNGIAWTDDENGFCVEFPDSVQISDDVEDEYSQPSYYRYDVPSSHGTERVDEPLDTQTLVVE